MPTPFRLTDADRATLQHWTRQTTIPQVRALCARCLMAVEAEPERLAQIAQEVGVSPGRLATWMRWYRKGGLSALADMPHTTTKE